MVTRIFSRRLSTDDLRSEALCISGDPEPLLLLGVGRSDGRCAKGALVKVADPLGELLGGV